MQSFFEELKRRRVLSAATAYFVVGWLIIEVSSVIIPTLLLPDWSMRLITILIIIGFPFAIALSWIYDFTSKGIEKTAAIDAEIDAPAEPSKASIPTQTTKNTPPSVAILPFEVFSTDEEQIVFAQGITTEIHSLLARHESIQVVSRRAVAKYADDLEGLVEKHGVGYILSGNVAFEQDRVRIIAELDDAKDDVQLWSQRFEKPLQGRLAIFVDISEAVVAGFGVERLRSEFKHARESNPENSDAWHLVQKARAHLLEPSTQTYKEARAWLKQATDDAPDYALAHASLAYAIGEAILNGNTDDNISADTTEIHNAIDKAVSLAPSDPVVLKMAGMALSVVGEPTSALTHINRAIEIAPHDFGSKGYLGWPLTARGQQADIEQLLTVLEHILEQAPDHPGAPFWQHHQAVALSCIDDLQTAQQKASNASFNAPTQSLILMNLANIQGRLGNLDDAHTCLKQALNLNSAMTPSHYIAQVERMNEGLGFVAARTDGLRQVEAH